jgi:hypothetical protein
MIRRVQIAAATSGNEYQATVVRTTDGAQPVSAESLQVTNLAEPVDQDGQLSTGTQAIALQVDGQWTVFVPTTSVFVGRIVTALGAGRYSIREQRYSETGTLDDAPEVAALAATNLAEVDVTPGDGLSPDTRVLVAAVPDTASPPTLHHVFDRSPGAAT